MFRAHAELRQARRDKQLVSKRLLQDDDDEEEEEDGDMDTAANLLSKEQVRVKPSEK